MKHAITPYQFTFFRILLGSYLALYFATLLPVASSVFLVEDQALFSDVVQLRFFVKPLEFINNDIFIKVFFVAMIVSSIMFASGFYRNINTIFLWIGWVFITQFNILPGYSGEFYIGWILLALIFLPEGEPLSFRRKVANWTFPRELYNTAWIVLALSYLGTGILFLTSPSWKNGHALEHIFNSLMSRDMYFVQILTELPALLAILSWILLAGILIYAPLSVFGNIRKWLWLIFVVLQVCMMVFIDQILLSAAILLFHLLVLDSRWFASRKMSVNNGENIAFFDGECGLCQSLVQFVQSEDQDHICQIAPLQGKTAKKHLTSESRNLDNGFVYFREGREIHGSTAMLMLAADLGGVWKILRVLLIVPRFLRDAVYRMFARFRYKLFGRLESCRLPGPGEGTFFLP